VLVYQQRSAVGQGGLVGKADVVADRWRNCRQEDGKVKVVFVSPDGQRYETRAKIGQNILDVAIENDVNIEGLAARFFFPPFSFSSLAI
jgi:hypothetical protein